MSLITIILVFVLVGVALWAINTYIPMPLFMTRLLNFVVGLVLVLWILKLFGLLAGLGTVHL